MNNMVMENTESLVIGVLAAMCLCGCNSDSSSQKLVTHAPEQPPPAPTQAVSPIISDQDAIKAAVIAELKHDVTVSSVDIRGDWAKASVDPITDVA
jgi:hypothetical protein